MKLDLSNVLSSLENISRLWGAPDTKGKVFAPLSVSEEKPYLHPTKGWKGHGTRSRGTNRRRVKI